MPLDNERHDRLDEGDSTQADGQSVDLDSIEGDDWCSLPSTMDSYEVEEIDGGRLGTVH